MKYCDICGKEATQTCQKCGADYCDDCALPFDIEYDGKDRFGKTSKIKLTIYTQCPICPKIKWFK